MGANGRRFQHGDRYSLCAQRLLDEGQGKLRVAFCEAEDCFSPNNIVVILFCRME